MTLHIRDGETQRAFVARTLLRDGAISAHEATYDLVDEAGGQRGITRLAACIEALRSDGWEISTDARHGEQAVYRLAPRHAGFPVGRIRTCPACRSEHHVGTTCAWNTTTATGSPVGAGHPGNPPAPGSGARQAADRGI